MSQLPLQENYGLISLSEVSKSEQPGSIWAERLEYGKICVSPEGPIEELAEHRRLGTSQNFPQEILSLCDPSVIGITSGPFDKLPEPPSNPTDKEFDYQRRHGTLLRPVILHNRGSVALLCRIRSRPEDGEGG